MHLPCTSIFEQPSHLQQQKNSLKDINTASRSFLTAYAFRNYAKRYEPLCFHSCKSVTPSYTDGFKDEKNVQKFPI